MTPRILVADDEPAIVMAVKDELAFEGFEVHTAASGLEALERARALLPDLLVLDLMLPGRNGFEVCRELRAERRDLWIIMLTVRGQEADRVTGFEAGVDDYVTKPFSLRELVGRVKVGLRRGGPPESDGPIRSGDLEIDLGARRVARGGAEVALTRTEFDILALLARRAGEVITRDEFLDQVWGREVYVTHRTVDTHVASLRRKIEQDSENPAHVQGVRGVGYRFAKP
jgi:two-component system, OmpR family, alkaline phosphatase synthesis response regulator PhoP